ncbi:MAG: SDR family oxidoreductase [Opitutales bacterium]|nr:SDR family oxidoreductase [Opitutales bacterium]
MAEGGQDLKGKVCLVTGANRGIGRAIAETFAGAGAIVYANARREGCMDEWCAGHSGRLTGEMVPCYFDVTDAGAASEGLGRIRKERGGLDVLVNNAAVPANDRLGMIPLEKARAVFEVNVFAVLHLLQLAGRLMMRKKAGSIINISSGVGLEGNPGQALYAASKGAVIALTKSAAKEWAPHGIRVNSVAPGLTRTEMIDEVKPEHLQERISRIRMGRLAEPSEIAEACRFLASDGARYITGQILCVDGSAVL